MVMSLYRIADEGVMGSNIDLSKYKTVFNENFNSLSLFNGQSGVWTPTYYWGGRTLDANSELEFYIDPSYKNLGINPFSVSNGIMSIHADKAAPSIQDQID